MGRLISVAAVLFAVQASAGGIVVCESMTPCRMPPPYLRYDTPALTFGTTDSGTIHYTVNLWLSENCSGSPDATVEAPKSPIDGAGYWFLPVDRWAVYPDGTAFSIQWGIDGCPPMDCVNGMTGSSPEVCQF